MSDSEDDSSHKSALNSADPPRNFSLSVGERIRALTIGVPAYATRKKSIEDLEASWIRTLVTLHDTLAARRNGRTNDDDDASMHAALLEKASTFKLERINRLIEAHNAYYPMEANLPMDLRTGEYLIAGRRWVPEEPWTAERLVDRARAFISRRDD